MRAADATSEAESIQWAAWASLVAAAVAVAAAVVAVEAVEAEAEAEAATIFTLQRSIAGSSALTFELGKKSSKCYLFSAFAHSVNAHKTNIGSNTGSSIGLAKSTFAKQGQIHNLQAQAKSRCILLSEARV